MPAARGRSRSGRSRRSKAHKKDAPFDGTARSWFITTWYDTPTFSLADMPNYDAAHRRYHTWVTHTSPKTDRLHQHHLFIALQPIRLSAIRKMFGDKIKAFPVQSEPGCLEYVQQSDPHEMWKHGVEGPWEEAGSLTAFQGTRTDIIHCNQLAHEGYSAKQIRQQVPSMYRCSRAVDQMVADCEVVPEERPITVYVIWGPPNCGKTTRARKKFPGSYLVSGGQTLTSFQDYDKQKTVIMDGWLSHQWQFTDMESYVKTFVVPINIKYGRVHSLWETLIITTNQHPESIYASTFNRGALTARFTHVLHWAGSLEDEFPWP